MDSGGAEFLHPWQQVTIGSGLMLHAPLDLAIDLPALRAEFAALDAATPRNPADYAAAQAELTRLKVVCHDATKKHLETVAAQMSPGEGRRFLDLTLPKLAGQTHAAPMDMR